MEPAAAFMAAITAWSVWRRGADWSDAAVMAGALVSPVSHTIGWSVIAVGVGYQLARSFFPWL